MGTPGPWLGVQAPDLLHGCLSAEVSLGQGLCGWDLLSPLITEHVCIAPSPVNSSVTT